MATYRNPAEFPAILGDAAGIRAAAAAWRDNAPYPEALAEIAAGTPVVDVYADTTDGYGYSIRVVVDPGVIAPDGLFIGAGKGNVLRFDSRDDRVSPVDQAKKMLAAQLSTVQVPIRYVRG